MTAALLILASDEDYSSALELLQTQGGQPFTLTLSDGSFLSFGEHNAETISVGEGNEVLEVSGAKFLTLSGAVRIIPLPVDPAEKERQQKLDKEGLV